jgi:hypothetical protein
MKQFIIMVNLSLKKSISLQVQHSWGLLFVVVVVDLDMEKDKNPKEVTIEIGTNGQEAYETLAEWVKTVPKTINELKKWH